MGVSLAAPADARPKPSKHISPPKDAGKQAHAPCAKGSGLVAILRRPAPAAFHSLAATAAQPLARPTTLVSSLSEVVARAKTARERPVEPTTAEPAKRPKLADDRRQEPRAIASLRAVVAAARSIVQLPIARPTNKAAATGACRPLNVNQATADQLMRLPGVGRALASTIISDRRTFGEFRSSRDLGRVPGVGSMLLRKLEPLLSV
jgi:competence protein ComEA